MDKVVLVEERNVGKEGIDIWSCLIYQSSKTGTNSETSLQKGSNTFTKAGNKEPERRVPPFLSIKKKKRN